jgi:hypothetical protein
MHRGLVCVLLAAPLFAPSTAVAQGDGAFNVELAREMLAQLSQFSGAAGGGAGGAALAAATKPLADFVSSFPSSSFEEGGNARRRTFTACTASVCNKNVGAACPVVNTSVLSGCSHSDGLYCDVAAKSCAQSSSVALGGTCPAGSTGLPGSAAVCAQRAEGPQTMCQGTPPTCKPLGWLWTGATCSCNAECQSGVCAAGACAAGPTQDCSQCDLFTQWCDVTVTPTVTYTCKPRVAAGAACPKAGSCPIGSICNVGTCVSQYSVANGQACDSPIACSSYYCDLFPGGSKTCRSPVAVNVSALPTCSNVLECNITAGESCSCLPGAGIGQRCFKTAQQVYVALGSAMAQCSTELQAANTCFNTAINSGSSCLQPGTYSGFCCCAESVAYSRCFTPKYYAELGALFGDYYSCATYYTTPSANYCTQNSNWVCNAFPQVTTAASTGTGTTGSSAATPCATPSSLWAFPLAVFLSLNHALPTRV